MNGKTRLIKRYYSQGGWTKEMAREMAEEQSRGKTPNFMRQVSLAFKAYLEKGIAYKEYLKMSAK
jgi:hypothetical protein